MATALATWLMASCVRCSCASNAAAGAGQAEAGEGEKEAVAELATCAPSASHLLEQGGRCSWAMGALTELPATPTPAASTLLEEVVR